MLVCGHTSAAPPPSGRCVAKAGLARLSSATMAQGRAEQADAIARAPTCIPRGDQKKLATRSLVTGEFACVYKFTDVKILAPPAPAACQILCNMFTYSCNMFTYSCNTFVSLIT